MLAKTFEIRDRATFIPVLAVQLEPTNERDRYLLARSGFGRSPAEQAEYIQLVRLAGGSVPSCSDPYDWSGGRTMQVAHDYIIKHWRSLDTGAVVDVEFILGEAAESKATEQYGDAT